MNLANFSDLFGIGELGENRSERLWSHIGNFQRQKVSFTKYLVRIKDMGGFEMNKTGKSVQILII